MNKPTSTQHNFQLKKTGAKTYRLKPLVGRPRAAAVAAFGDYLLTNGWVEQERTTIGNKQAVIYRYPAAEVQLWEGLTAGPRITVRESGSVQVAGLNSAPARRVLDNIAAVQADSEEQQHG